MLTLKCSRLCLSLLLFLLVSPLQADEKYAPLPKAITEAKTVYIENHSDNPRVADAAYLELTNWGRFTVVSDRQEAELILTFDAISKEGPIVVVPLAGGPIVGGRTTQNFIRFAVLSPEGRELWTVTQPASGGKNLKKSGTAKCIRELRKRFPPPKKEKG